jgi:hypothetical protein
MADRTTANVKRTSGKHLGKVAPSTKAHEVYDTQRKCVVRVGSRTDCNAWWVRLDPEVRAHHVVQVVRDTRW